MNILVTYDVNTETKDGKRRLRKVATVCKNFGQRVQYSVFECQVDESQYESLQTQLVKIIDQKLDNLRFYRLMSPRENAVEAFGIDRYINFNEPLIL